MCTERKQTPAYMCECNRGGASYTLMPQAAVVFSISDNFCLVLHWSSPHFSAPTPSPSLFTPGGFCRESFLSLAWPRVDSPPVVAALSAVFRRRSGGNNARAVSQYRAIIYFRSPKGGMRAERESKTWDNYSMLPELLHHAGWILPVWLLKIIGSSHREEPLAL